MFRDFLSFFNMSIELNYSDDIYNDFILQLGGKIYGNGLFNSFSYENIEQWTEIVSDAYPEFKNMFRLFGHDWLGRCFGIDLRKNTHGNVLMFEIGTNDVLEIPCSFRDFLNKEIPLHTDACLARGYFNEWKKVSGGQLGCGRCAGYKIPLFLGGEDTIDNLENSDMEVYWSVLSQIKSIL